VSPSISFLYDCLLCTILMLSMQYAFLSTDGTSCPCDTWQTTLSKVVWEQATLHHKLPIGYNGAPHSCPKLALSVDRSQNPTTCLIPVPVWPTIPNCIHIRSAVLPQCTRQTNTHRQTNTWLEGMFDDYRPLSLYREFRSLIIIYVIFIGQSVSRPRSAIRNHAKCDLLATIARFVMIIMCRFMCHCQSDHKSQAQN